MFLKREHETHNFFLEHNDYSTISDRPCKHLTANIELSFSRNFVSQDGREKVESWLNVNDIWIIATDFISRQGIALLLGNAYLWVNQ